MHDRTKAYLAPPLSINCDYVTPQTSLLTSLLKSIYSFLNISRLQIYSRVFTAQDWYITYFLSPNIDEVRWRTSVINWQPPSKHNMVALCWSNVGPPSYCACWAKYTIHRRWPNDVLMLVQSRRRWANVCTAFGDQLESQKPVWSTRKTVALTQHWIEAGPPSATIAQHYINIGSEQSSK